MGKIRIEKPFTGLLAGRQDVDRFRFTGWAEREKDLGRPGWLLKPSGGDAAQPPPGAGLRLFRAFTAQGHGLSIGGPAKEYFWGDDYRLATITTGFYSENKSNEVKISQEPVN